MRTNALRYRRRWAVAVVGATALATLAGCAAAPVSSAQAAGGAQPASIPVAFEWRTLEPMSAESLRPYACPVDLPYLASENHASFGDALIDGVEVDHPDGHTRVAVTIMTAAADETGRATGISTEPMTTSAVNWSSEPASYRIILHCAADE